MLNINFLKIIKIFMINKNNVVPLVISHELGELIVLSNKLIVKHIIVNDRLQHGLVYVGSEVEVAQEEAEVIVTEVAHRGELGQQEA